MGLVYSNITLANPVIGTIKPIEVMSLVDTGATYSCISQHIANQLQLSELQKREVTLADGSSSLVPYVGPIKVTFENRICFVGAMV